MPVLPTTIGPTTAPPGGERRAGIPSVAFPRAPRRGGGCGPPPAAGRSPPLDGPGPGDPAPLGNLGGGACGIEVSHCRGRTGCYSNLSIPGLIFEKNQIGGPFWTYKNVIMSACMYKKMNQGFHLPAPRNWGRNPEWGLSCFGAL